MSEALRDLEERSRYIPLCLIARPHLAACFERVWMFS